MADDPVELTRLSPADRRVAVATVARAFWPDPLFGFFARDLLHEHRGVGFFRVVLEDCARHGDVWVARRGSECVGSASWLPPGGMPRSKIREARIFSGAVTTIATGRNRRLGIELLNEVEKRHPADPHWYLALLAVDPRFQGKGYGRLLLEPGLERCDDEGLPAYLETQKEANLAFYHRFGFELREQVVVPGAPPVWLMWREPR